MSDGMATTVRTLADAEAEIRAMADEIRELQGDLAESRSSAETFMLALGNDEAMAVEIRSLRDFIADVQRGIRDLSEYEDVCGP